MADLVYHVMQDGADFYVFDAPDCEKLLMTRTAPFKVADFDMDSAMRARKWFTELCSVKTRQTMKWIGA